MNYWKHFIGGGIIGVILSQTFNGVPIFWQFFITTFVTLVVGVMWEWFWKIYNKSAIDYYDVFWAIVGAVASLTIKLIIS